ncbi:Protein DOG1-like 4 [Linum grandiflorum]
MPKSTVAERFAEFDKTWTAQLEEYIPQLISAAAAPVDHAAMDPLVAKLTQHHKGYYSAKWALVHEDVHAFFSLPWASPLEKAYSWFTGWKPSTMFKVVLDSNGVVSGFGSKLTPSQLAGVAELRLKVKLEEDKVERDMERQHVALAGGKIVELARMSSRRGGDGDVAKDADGRVEDGMVDVALKGIAGGLEKVVRAADCVRLRTLKGILEILTPLQSVAFFAASGALLIRLRKFGLARAENVNSKQL